MVACSSGREGQIGNSRFALRVFRPPPRARQMAFLRGGTPNAASTADLRVEVAGIVYPCGFWRGGLGGRGAGREARQGITASDVVIV